MPPLPVVSGRDAAKIFQKVGFLFHRQKGSHMIYYRADGVATSRFLIIASSIVELCAA